MIWIPANTISQTVKVFSFVVSLSILSEEDVKRATSL